MASNGRLDTASLTKVDGWAFLEARAAVAWVAGCDKMVRLGFKRPTITAPDGAYRTLERQLYWKKFWSERGLPGNAAWPGWSNHGFGTAVDIWDVWKWPQVTFRSVFREFGFVFDVPSEAWHMRHNGMYVNPDTMLAGGTGTQIEIEDTLSAAEVNQITNAIADSEARIKTAIRRESRGRLYFDAGVDGLTPEGESQRAVVAKLTSGYIYPLNADPALRVGQVASLRNTHYLLVDSLEVFEGLPTEQFENMLEQANGHLRRIAAETARQVDNGETPPSTPATVPDGINPTPALAGAPLK